MVFLIESVLLSFLTQASSEPNLQAFLSTRSKKTKMFLGVIA